MTNKGYITIQGWMVNELGLSGNELICYAIIYGFSQDGESEYNGSLSYMAESINCTKEGVRKIIKKLVDAELVNKRDEEITRGIKVCYYSANLKKLTAANKVVWGGQQSCTDNYNDNNKKEEIDKSISKKDEFSTLAAEPPAEYEKPRKKRNVTPKDDALFEECWIAYDRKGHKNKAKPYWDKLPQEVRERILPHIKAYVSVREKSYQQDFERYLKDKTYDTVVYDRNTLIYDPERITNKDEYRPVESLYLSWDERSQCYVTCSNIEMLCDGYTDENRPNGAKVKKNGYVYIWDSSLKQWVNKQ